MPKVLTQPKKTQTAFFRVSPSALKLTPEDKAAGILRGVKIMELGKLASFEGSDGSVRQARITQKHIDALLGYAGNRALPIHWTHAWHKAEADKSPDADRIELEARCGAWKQFRKDEDGDAVADAYLRNDDHREDILFAAEHNPEDLMASAVFNYEKNDPESMPINFRCADFVPCGAATTALFSEADSTSNDTMPDTDILSLLAEAAKDPTKRAALKALIKEIEKGDVSEEEAPAAEMEKAADVTDADKKDDDKDKPALMRAMIRVSRAISRKTAELAATESALLAKVDVKVKASETALLGKGKFTQSSGEGDENPVAKFNAAVKELTDKGVKESAATIAVIDKSPELYKATQVALFAATVSR